MAIAHADVLEDSGRFHVPYFDLLQDSLDLTKVPFTERGSRILVGLGTDGDSDHQTDAPRLRRGAGLEIRMAERWSHLEARLGNHRTRAPLIDALKPTDEAGHELPYQLTTWPHKLLLWTSAGQYEVFFGDRQTLYVRSPDGECGLSFSVMADNYHPDERGAVFESPRCMSLTSAGASGRLALAGESGGRLKFSFKGTAGGPNALVIHIPESGKPSRSTPPAEIALKGTEQSWREWFDAAPRVGERYWRPYYLAWTVLRSGLLSPAGHLKREALAPSKTKYLGIWHWDAYFHALAYRHVDDGLAQDQLLALLDHQLDNGLIPDVVHDEGLIQREDGPGGRDLTKPPLIGWAALKLFESGCGSRFLRAIYEPLVRWNNWWLEECDDDKDGICQYDHAFSSGLDDSPLWDCGTPVESPDLSTYLCIHMQSLAAIARIIGRPRDAERWDLKARELARRINSHFYDSRTGIFWATKDHVPIDVLTPLNLLPIWTGLLPPQQVRAVVGNLTNQSTFWSRFGIPTVSLSDPSFTPDRMWRGPVWINVNYMVVEALSRVGYHGLAATLADKTIELVMRSGVGEYFNALTGDVPSRAAPAFGWSAALFVDLLVRRTRERRLALENKTYAGHLLSTHSDLP